jgi:predicted MPP superfamily phosphohydrolase
MSLFFIFFSILLLFSWAYLWWRLVLTSHLPKKWKLLTEGTLVFLLLVQFVLPFLYRGYAFGKFMVSSSVFWFGYSVLGFMVLLVFAALARDLIIFISQKTFAQNYDAKRRLFLLRTVNTLAVGVAASSAIVGTNTALMGPVVREVLLPIDDLHPDLDGFSIAQISDVHVGPTIRRIHVERIVRMVLDTYPHMIAVTGDLADGTPSQLSYDLEPLLDLKAPFGAYYVSGNHDYYWDADAWTEKVKTLGLDPLNNEHRILTIKKARLLVGGVRDYSCGRIIKDHVSDPHLAIQNASPVDFKILLAHQPQSCYKALTAGFNLQLSGHTHHGQFVPWNLITRFAFPYYKGLNLHENKLWVYVNAATGYWGPPQRLGIPSEITLIRLKASKKG